MYKIDEVSGKARAGKLIFKDKTIETPLFMPVATKGVVKTLTFDEVKKCGINAIICNAYHFEMSIGSDFIKKMGGIHKFIGWNGIIFTDSGGFQAIRKDFKFKSVDEGYLIEGDEKTLYTPHKCMEVQKNLSADVFMVLDDCPEYPYSKKKAWKTAERTVKWAKKCIEMKDDKKLFGIIQGGIYEEIRKWCAEKLSEMPFDGYAVGGLSIGENKSDMWKSVSYSIEKVPWEKPRYFMGLGKPSEILKGVLMGIDIFDSAYPTRNARHGHIFTKNGIIDAKKRKYIHYEGPVEEDCNCLCCEKYTLSYIHNLFRQKEMLAMRLATIHNLTFMMRFMRKIRESILKDELNS